MTVLKLTQIGDSVGLILPKELLARLKVELGDVLFVSQSEDGALTLSTYDPAVAEQVERGREFMRQFRDAFLDLAAS